MMHIKFTIMVLFMNIALIFFLPNIILGENNLFTENSEGQYVISGTLEDEIQELSDPEGGLPVGSFGITDIITLLWGIFVFLFKVLFSSFIVLQYLYLAGNEWALILGVPLVISYALAVVGWIK